MSTGGTARRRLLILGAGGFGREVLWTTTQIPVDARDWEVGGFLDDDPAGAARALALKGVDLPVLGSIREYAPEPNDVLTCAIGSTRARVAVCCEMRRRGAAFANLVHPTALIHPHAQLGTGLILRQWSVISADCTIGDDIVFDRGAGAGHDATVMDGCFLGAQSEVMGGAALERGVFLGGHAVVLPGVRVGAFATVGAGTVAIRRVGAEHTVFGVPGKRLDFSA